MSLEALISSLREKDIQMRLDGEALLCDAPAGAMTQELLSEISQRKSEIVAYFHHEAANRDAGAAPASYAQTRLWRRQRLRGDATVSHLALILRLRGPLDTNRLETALTCLVRRHESLRARFGDTEAGVELRFAPPYEVELPTIDLRDLSAEDGESEAMRRISIATEHPLDLTGSHPWSAELIALYGGEHLLAFVVHRAVCDLVSLDILADDLTLAYAAACVGEPAALPPLSIRHADHACSQLATFEDPSQQALLTRYADFALAEDGIAFVTPDRPRTALAGRRARCERRLLEELLPALQSLAAAESADLDDTLLATTQLLLFRHARQPTVAVARLAARRPLAGADTLVGPLAGAIVVRTPVDATMSGLDLIRSAADCRRHSTEFDAVPVEKLAQMSAAEDAMLFQAGVAPLRDARKSVHRDSLEWQRLDDNDPLPDAEFTLSFERRPAGDAIIAHYDAQLFDAATIERLLAQFETLANALAHAPADAVGKLPLLPPGERELIDACNSVDWNQDIAETVHELFERCVERAPDALAVVAGERSLSYASLNAEANRLAHALIKHGIGPGRRVGIYCQRDAGLTVALLAALKAGAAYVPVDPAYPRERIEFMLADARVGVVLAPRALAASLPTSAQVIAVDDDDARVAALVLDTNPAARATGRDLSHVIYTSGSTGRPKGTMIEHRSVLALLDWARRTYSDEDIRNTLASTSICFDLSVFEIFVPLGFGATVHLVENVLELPQYPGRDEITLINTVPSALTELLRNGDLPRAVRVVNLAGEPLPRVLVDAAYAQPQVDAVYNLYGPTEDTTYSTFARVPRDGMEAPTIGKPLPGSAVHILDADLQPLPIGAVGEIHLSGVGLARGYLNCPELNAARFLHAPGNGHRLYRTGDLGRRLADGQIAFLGRTDFQVKIRGFRIELGEIEAALRELPQVREAVAVARTDKSGDPIVVAFVVPEQGTVDVKHARTHLRSMLPAYMLPAAIIAIDTIPLTVNGKIDRKALPDHVSVAPTTRAGQAPAHSEIERQIAVIWQELLGAQIGANDNFFEVGGHSLLALQMHKRLSALLGRTVPIMELFRHPTIRSLAEFLTGDDRGSGDYSEMAARMNRQREVRAKRRNINSSAKRT